ncbi:hypothetical protein RO07_19155 [Pandoraea pulmonicola]|uniref:Uncharacterized protein n=1 Tax=Pandoraea pulmonicola TaxID=93221 RepID=A0ABN4ERQ0_PANPU|nr:hypothetical protein RO07_19155 [Pandoraea pulmonicola]
MHDNLFLLIEIFVAFENRAAAGMRVRIRPSVCGGPLGQMNSTPNEKTRANRRPGLLVMFDAMKR